MKKLLLIPRAVADILSIWGKQLTLKEKSSLTYTLAVLKVRKWINKKNTVISYPLLGQKVFGINSESLQFLIKEIFVDKVYEVGEYFGNKPNLKIIDAGANIGLSVLFFQSRFNTATIIAYEPNETSFNILKKNIEVNAKHRVTPVQTAISDHDGVLYAEEGQVQASVNQRFSINGHKEKPVVATRLGNILLDKVDCVKMDIEGAEIAALKDVIENNGLKKSNCWLIEFHDQHNERESIIKEFEKNGFVWKQKKDVYCFVQTKLND